MFNATKVVKTDVALMFNRVQAGDMTLNTSLTPACESSLSDIGS